MIKKVNFLIIIVGVLFTACFEKAVAPVLEFNGKANMTIAEFQQLRELSTAPPTLIDTNIIITGIVTSTDEFGSCYRELFFQDETGGLSIRVANTSYFIRYCVGQRIFVRTEGLSLGNYSNASGTRIGFYQLGFPEEGGQINIPNNLVNRYIFPSGIPEAPPNPKIITKASDIDVERDYHTLVKLENCYFVNAKDGNRFYETRFDIGSQASQSIKFNSGSGTDSVIARIPPRATFANDILPSGAVNVTGLLTKFGIDHQLIIRSINDVEILPPLKILKTFDMTTSPFLEEWKNEQVTGVDEWIHYSQGIYSRVEISSKNETECKLVSPKFNFSGEKNVVLFFTYRLPDGASENVRVLYTTDGTNWVSLGFTPQIGSITEGMVKLNDNIATNPNLQIAFEYKTTTLFPTWMIMNIAFKANAQ